MIKDNHRANANLPSEEITEGHGEQLGHNGFVALADLGDRDLEVVHHSGENGNGGSHEEQLGFAALVDSGDKSHYSIPKAGLLEVRPQSPQALVVDMDEAKDRANSASNSSTTVNVSSRKGGNCKAPTREYNLRNKPLMSSPIHASSFTIASNVDSVALRSMRMTATKSWANQCEEEEISPKYGADSVLR